jgi:hypothetical protein
VCQFSGEEATTGGGDDTRYYHNKRMLVAKQLGDVVEMPISGNEQEVMLQSGAAITISGIHISSH